MLPRAEDVRDKDTKPEGAPWLMLRSSIWGSSATMLGERDPGWDPLDIAIAEDQCAGMPGSSVLGEKPWNMGFRFREEILPPF
jgi:hypothetical protein